MSGQERVHRAPWTTQVQLSLRCVATVMTHRRTTQLSPAQIAELDQNKIPFFRQPRFQVVCYTAVANSYIA